MLLGSDGVVVACSRLLILHAISKLLRSAARSCYSVTWVSGVCSMPFEANSTVCEFRMLALTKKNSSESTSTLSPFSLEAFRSVIVSTIRIKPHDTFESLKSFKIVSFLRISDLIRT